MQRFTNWLRARGTRFSLLRRYGVTKDSHVLRSLKGKARSVVGSSAGAGMARLVARSKKHEGARGTEGSTRASNDITNLTAVEGLQEGTGSGVYVVEREGATMQPDGAKATKARSAMNPLLEQVTLVVYGWKSVEPGTLSWVFPSVGAAVAAARAMTNAVRWAIVAGKRDHSVGDEDLAVVSLDEADLNEARAKGAVLIEQAG